MDSSSKDALEVAILEGIYNKVPLKLLAKQIPMPEGMDFWSKFKSMLRESPTLDISKLFAGGRPVPFSDEEDRVLLENDWMGGEELWAKKRKSFHYVRTANDIEARRRALKKAKKEDEQKEEQKEEEEWGEGVLGEVRGRTKVRALIKTAPCVLGRGKITCDVDVSLECLSMRLPHRAAVLRPCVSHPGQLWLHNPRRARAPIYANDVPIPPGTGLSLPPTCIVSLYGARFLVRSNSKLLWKLSVG